MHGVAKQGGEPNTPFEYLMELNVSRLWKNHESAQSVDVSFVNYERI
jgi:hypothetical protein